MLLAVAVTPMRKVAALCEFFGVRVALHGPGDCSPVGMMANLAIDLSISNLGIQELDYVSFREKTGANEVFPGFELIGPRDGMLWRCPWGPPIAKVPKGAVYFVCQER